MYMYANVTLMCKDFVNTPKDLLSKPQHLQPITVQLNMETLLTSKTTLLVTQ